MSRPTPPSQPPRRATFAITALAVLAVDATVARWIAAQGQAVPEWPLLVDLLIVLPMAGWVLLRPQRRQALWLVLGLVSAGILAGSWILPSADQHVWHLLSPLRWTMLGALALGQLGLAALVLRDLWRTPPGHHPEPVLHAALTRRFGEHPLLGLLQTDARLWLYAWPGQQAQRAFDDGETFGTHRQGQNASNQQAFLILMAAELPIAHGLVQLWSPALAWTLTALSAYGWLFLWAEWRATRWRPISLQADALQLRVGLLVDARLPLQAIRAVERSARPLARTAGHWRLVGMGRANVQLQLQTGTRLRTPLGDRLVTAIDLGVDEPDRFIAALRARLDCS